MTRCYLGVDPGGSPGLALVEHNDSGFTLLGHMCLKGWASNAGWEPWRMTSADEFPYATICNDNRPTDVVIERQRAWGPGDGGTKIIIAYACISVALARAFGDRAIFRGLEPRTWEKIIRGELATVGIEKLKNKKMFTDAAMDHFFHHNPRMTQHERDAALLAVSGALVDMKAERVLRDLQAPGDAKLAR